MTLAPTGSLPARAAAQVADFAREHRRFLRTLVVYGFGQFGSKGLDLFGFALLVKTLSPSQLGFVGAAILAGYLVTDILSLGVPRIAAPRFVLEKTYARADVMSTAFGVFLIYAAVTVPLIALMPSGAIRMIGLGGFDTAFRLYMLAWVMRAFVIQEIEVLRMEQRPILQSFAEGAPSALNLLALLLLLPGAPDKVAASGLAQVVGWGLPFVWVFGYACLKVRPSLKLVRPLLGYSVPLLMHRMMSDLNAMASRWVVLLTLGLPAAGAFTFLARLGELMKLAVMPLQKAWVPMLLGLVAKGEERRADRVAVFYMVAATAILLATLIGGRWLAELIDHRGTYRGAYAAIAVVAVGNWIYAYYIVLGIGFFVAKKPGRIVPITATTAALNIALSWAFARAGGVEAVPWGLLIANIFFVAMTYLFGRKLFRYHSRMVPVTAAATIAVAVAAFGLSRLIGG